MRFAGTSAVLSVVLLSVAPGAADARTRAPHLSWLKCMSKCSDRFTVAPGGKVKLAGARLPRGSHVVFPVRRSNGAHATRSMKPSSRSSTRIVVTVPSNARSGRLYVKARRARSNLSPKLRIRKLPRAGGTPPPTLPPSGTAFDGGGMWIWYLSKANGGDTNAIIAQARAHGISTVFVKSGDGGSYWSQFTPGLVSALKAGGLRGGGWQAVYGDKPAAEAAVAARAVGQGADCFVIDAESEYEGRYSQASTYITKLRAAVGATYPLGL